MESVASDADQDLPPSAKFVATVLGENGAMTIGELHEETGMKKGTVHNAVNVLVENGDVEKRVDLRDNRRRICELVSESD